jgi:hypothetical protein
VANGVDQADVHRGRFWLPDQRENAVSGLLTLPEGTRARLELDQAVTPLLREVEREKQPSGTRTLVLTESGPGREPLDVHGVLEDGTLVTLGDAVENRRETGADYDRQSLRARSVVLGGHCERPRSLHATAAAAASPRDLGDALRCGFRHLRSSLAP